MVGWGGLGLAQLEAGELSEAERAFIEATAAAEEMGIVTEMLGFMVHAARVIGLAGRKTEAVRLLSSVLAEPMSEKMNMSDLVTVEKLASDALEAVRDGLTDSEFATAADAGRSLPYETAAKELIDSIR